MKLYFVRHGETDLNAKNVHQDHTSDLSITGVHQAELLALRFEHIQIDRILASPYNRAKQTAEIIARVVRKPIEFTPLLVEIKRPTIIEGMLYDQPEAVAIKRQIYEKFHEPDYKHSDEETFMDLRDRASLLLHHVQSLKEKNILLVSHGEFVKVIVSVMIFGLDLDPKHALKFYHSLKMTNTGLTLCEWRETYWKLVTWNDQAHLGD